MTDPIDKASEEVGSQAELARRLGVYPSMITQLSSGERPVPVRLAVAIERETDGVVRRWDLRPDDWHLIWPELVGVEGAPAVTNREAA